MRGAALWLFVGVGGCITEDRACAVVEDYVETFEPAFVDASPVDGTFEVAFAECLSSFVDRSARTVEVRAAVRVSATTDSVRAIRCDVEGYANGLDVVGCWYECDPVVGVCSLASPPSAVDPVGE